MGKEGSNSFLLLQWQRHVRERVRESERGGERGILTRTDRGLAALQVDRSSVQ